MWREAGETRPHGKETSPTAPSPTARLPRMVACSETGAYRRGTPVCNRGFWAVSAVPIGPTELSSPGTYGARRHRDAEA
jgi:hypothetical protein